MGPHLGVDSRTLRVLGHRKCPSFRPLAPSLVSQVRDRIMPINRRYTIPQLMQCLAQEFGDGTKGKSHVLVEYLLLDGINDRCGSSSAPRVPSIDSLWGPSHATWWLSGCPSCARR